MISSRIGKVGILSGDISQSKELTGKIVQQNTINGSVSTANCLVLKSEINKKAQLNAKILSKQNLAGGLTIPLIIDSKEKETYEGDYIITPKVVNQSLETKNKLMKNDVTVLAIPYFETSNLTGKTVYIGGE